HARPSPRQLTPGRLSPKDGPTRQRTDQTSEPTSCHPRVAAIDVAEFTLRDQPTTRGLIDALPNVTPPQRRTPTTATFQRSPRKKNHRTCNCTYDDKRGQAERAR